MKGINQTSLNPMGDIGQDGTAGSSVARDELSFSLHYFEEQAGANYYHDYIPIGGTSAFADRVSASNMPSLYNGNIAAMAVNIGGLRKADPGNTNAAPLLYRYNYDQLNRIVEMQTHTGLDIGANRWDPVELDDYKETISYDHCALPFTTIFTS